MSTTSMLFSGLLLLCAGISVRGGMDVAVAIFGGGMMAYSIVICAVDYYLKDEDPIIQLSNSLTPQQRSRILAALKRYAEETEPKP